MREKQRNLCVCAALALLLLTVQAGAVQVMHVPTQLTVDNVFHAYPRIGDGGHVAWVGGAANPEVFLYNGTRTIQLTSNGFLNGVPFYGALPGAPAPSDEPEIDINASGQVVWSAVTSSGTHEIFFYDGITTTQLTTNAYEDVRPRLNNSGQVVWQGMADGATYDIFLYDGVATQRLTTNSFNDVAPGINDSGDIVWMWQDGDGASYKVVKYVQPNTTPCPIEPKLYSPSGSGAPGGMRTFMWEDTAADWINIQVWSEGPNCGTLNAWYAASAVCQGSICKATPPQGFPVGRHWWWVNVWNSECGFKMQAGGKINSFTVDPCTAPRLISPDSDAITTGTKPTFIFSDSGAEWYNVLVWTSAGYLALSQWEDAAVTCSAGTCTVVSNRSFGAGTTNWWWLNSYGTSCGFQMQPGGLWKSFTMN